MENEKKTEIVIILVMMIPVKKSTLDLYSRTLVQTMHESPPYAVIRISKLMLDTVITLTSLNLIYSYELYLMLFRPQPLVCLKI